MKKCPTCNKTFEDSMRFCQTDGTPLVDDEPAFDPYATIMARPGDLAPPPTEEPSAPEAPVQSQQAEEIVLEPLAAAEPAPETPAEPIAVPDDVLELPADPLKTMYVSEAEMQAAFGTSGDAKPADEAPQPEQPIFSVPDVPAPNFGDVAPPPSPFSTSEPAPAAPPFEPAAPLYEEAPTILHSQADSPFDPPPPAPVEQWTPPPAPDASWQNKEIGSNTPFEPPPAGAGGPSQGLAIGSLICGILSCLCCMSLLTGPAAMIMGFIAKKNADQNPAQYGGRGMALGGMIAGGLGIFIGIAQAIWLLFLGGLSALTR